jgi:hypothetical protein
MDRHHLHLIKLNPSCEAEGMKNKTQEPPFASEQRRSNLKKEKTNLDSIDDQPHQDHHPIHYISLVLRERDSYL